MEFRAPTPGQYVDPNGTVSRPHSAMEKLPRYRVSIESDPPSYESEDPVQVRGIKKCHVGCGRCCRRQSTLIVRIILAILFTAFTVYMAFAMRHNLEYAKALVVITGMVVFFIVYGFIRDHFGHIIYDGCFRHVEMGLRNHWHCMRWWARFYFTVKTLALLKMYCINTHRIMLWYLFVDQAFISVICLFVVFSILLSIIVWGFEVVARLLSGLWGFQLGLISTHPSPVSFFCSLYILSLFDQLKPKISMIP